ncbi:hypothetical protein [Staphylococcus phage S25-3]|uniref:Uncharacterized protein n=1 Tax=Staphylococcus phage S25-3 TaxID=1041526 RepID=V5XVR3_BPS25|nr:hypothetical protein X600_gp197 [Staphylococcus phage S25-3]QDJ97510.1 hypothetical protein PALS1_076 [Staphylococcus phage PALS_1]BAO09172.1 hypothetical protein [Staphylococcus phage S25-3]
MEKNFYVLENELITTEPTDEELENLLYVYDEPIIYELDNNEYIIVNELDEQWELIKKLSNYYVSKKVSHNMQELKDYIK